MMKFLQCTKYFSISIITFLSRFFGKYETIRRCSFISRFQIRCEFNSESYITIICIVRTTIHNNNLFFTITKFETGLQDKEPRYFPYEIANIYENEKNYHYEHSLTNLNWVISFLWLHEFHGLISFLNFSTS